MVSKLLPLVMLGLVFCSVWFHEAWIPRSAPCKCRQPRESVKSIPEVCDRAGVATAAGSASRHTAWELRRGGCSRVWSYKLAHVSGGE